MMKIGTAGRASLRVSRMFFSGLALCSAVVHAESASNIHDVVVQALEANPDLQARYHAFTAASYQVGEARAGYLPSVDISATAGRGTRDFDGLDRYSTGQGQVSL